MGVATERAVLIRYSVNGQRFVGSGLRMRDRFVLTADHCAKGASHRIEFLDGSSYPATVHVRSCSSEVDIAVLLLGEKAPSVEGLSVARIDRSVVGTITDCQALGFPRWRRDGRGAPVVAQIDGFVPTGEGLRPGTSGADLEFLELKGTGPSVRGHPVSPGELVQTSPWGGMSGAAVVVDGVVLGVVRSHNLAAGDMSLTVTPLTALEALPAPVAEEFSAALGLSDAAHWRVLPDQLGLLSREVLRVLDSSGRPPLVEQVSTGSFGARKARTDLDLHGDDYYPYVPRELDVLIGDALDRRVDGSDRRILLLVGEAMAGKSRAGAQALQAHPVLRSQPLLVPTRGSGVGRIVELVTELMAGTGSDLAGTVLWLDDLNGYFAWLTEGLAATWRAMASLTVIATVRRDQLATLQNSPDLRATWEFVNDEDQVEKIPIPSEWSEADQRGLTDAPAWIRSAVAQGTPLGELLGSARELLLKLENADAPLRALVEVVVDWQRTGMPSPIPEHVCLALWPNYLPLRAAATMRERNLEGVKRLLNKARKEACKPIRGTAASLLTAAGPGLWAEDLLVHARTTQGHDIHATVWDAAIDHALGAVDAAPDVVNLIGANAAMSGEYEVARKAWEPAAENGYHVAQGNLGLLLATRLVPPELHEARRWYTAAAEAGDAFAQVNLGILLANEWDPRELDEARRWYTAAAEAGDPAAQNILGLFLETQWDPPELDEARGWYTAAAVAGHIRAQNSLALLLATKGPPSELDEARRWFTAAAEAGDADAQYNLGFLLATKCDPPEFDKARRWFAAAAEGGVSQAREALRLLSNPDA